METLRRRELQRHHGLHGTPDGNILFTEFVGGSVAINTLNTFNGNISSIWEADESIRAGSEEMSLSVSGKAAPTLAFIRPSWNMLPEIYCGSINKLTQVTHLNTAMQHPMPKAENIQWINERKHEGHSFEKFENMIDVSLRTIEWFNKYMSP